MTAEDKAGANKNVRKNDSFMTQIAVQTCNDIEDGKPFDSFSVLKLFLLSSTCLGHHERHSNNKFHFNLATGAIIQASEFFTCRSNTSVDRRR